MDGLRRALQSEAVRLVLRSSGLEPDTWTGPRPAFSRSPDLNLSNSTSGNFSCNLLLDPEDLKDGKLPQVLGIALAAWLVSLKGSRRAVREDLSDFPLL